MNIQKTFIALVLLYAFGGAQSADAYFTTGQSALKVDETHALFVIEYTFGLKDNDLYMPGVSSNALLAGTQAEKVGFEIIADGRDEVKKDTITSAVLSTAPVVDGMYKLEKGVAQKLWLVALLETDIKAHEADYALQITHLPFYADMGAQKRDERKLNPSELQYYVTKEVELNTGNFN